MPERPSVGRDGATHRVEFDVEHDQVDLVAARLWAAGALGIWQQPTRLVAWFDDPTPDLPTDLAAVGEWSIEPDRDWQEEWKATIAPVRAGAITVVPTWLADEVEPGTSHDELTIVLDPGRAFGSGHHATTTMCLELLDELDLEGCTVADVGCGTGVLAIAAALRGANAIGVDIDPTAIEVTAENAARNGVTIPTRVGSVDALPFDSNGGDGDLGNPRADVVVANLVTDVIVALADDLVGVCRATLVVSGIAAGRAAAARSALEAAGATVTDVRDRDGWVAMRAHVE